MDKWFELEETYLTNQPIAYRRGKRIPDPDFPPTEAYLFGWKCERRPRGIKRKRAMEHIKAKNADVLNNKIIAFSLRKDVIVIKEQQPLRYAYYKGEPQ